LHVLYFILNLNKKNCKKHILCSTIYKVQIQLVVSISFLVFFFFLVHSLANPN